jgi:DNA-3-methyladenine glycosylase I
MRLLRSRPAALGYHAYMRKQSEKPRCPWCLGSDTTIRYHDQEWGVPVHEDRLLLEFLILEGAQAGLSWATILNKRENYRRALAGFDAAKLARFGARDVERLMKDAGIVRNRLKIGSAIQNARAFRAVRQEFGTFDAWIWQFTGGQTLQHARRSMQDVPASTTQSEAMSRELRQRGFRFVGPTICYAFMQAVGMVNDHLASCHRHAKLARIKNTRTHRGQP